MDTFLNYRGLLNEALDTVDPVWLSMFGNTILRSAENGHKIFVAGNGGSAAISEHLSCDHNKGVMTDTNLTPFIISLPSNVSLLTAIANDIGYDQVFSKQLEWFADSNDILLVISSSGNSPNIIQALKTAKKINMTRLALVGFDGGAAADLADITVHVKSNNYGVVEDCHQIIMHSVAQHIRTQFATDPSILKL